MNNGFRGVSILVIWAITAAICAFIIGYTFSSERVGLIVWVICMIGFNMGAVAKRCDIEDEEMDEATRHYRVEKLKTHK